MWSFDFASLALRYAQDEREISAVRPERSGAKSKDAILDDGRSSDIV